ncbi:cytokine receptor common subunit gamma [Latimeria chalumnae]|uniref:cytokine receptor common subunit gamma n=1 Tax=Latimeria chalumnae TaxID=7897 RepID=UPI0003C19F75|nr:PREDICTED: cytokine receptor common subunit gamma [Latimeria chalumnae]XP_014348619.1 PREDICTED: cytokine receptor common subunit gamma [Latimeria chalumnae]|eukprot:XP_014348618.1 PREDICTED: cytokine receptor common subunit gamma [Latimeria chalumnae]
MAWLLASPLVWLLLYSSKAEEAQKDGNVDCIVYNDELMKCMWNKTGIPKLNYTLHYWYSDIKNKTECKKYLQEHSTNIGCRFEPNEIIQFREFHVQLSTVEKKEPINVFRLQNRVLPYPPTSLTFKNTEVEQIELKWEASMKTNCLEHQVKYKSNKDSDWTVISNLQTESFRPPSVDPEKFYTFFVRSKVNVFCGSTDLWSEWSIPAYWGKDPIELPEEQDSVFWIWRLLIPMLSIVILIILASCLVRAERLRVIIIPKIPSPEGKVDDLINGHHGNIHEWINISKDLMDGFAPNYNETMCLVNEQLPPGSGEADRSLQQAKESSETSPSAPPSSSTHNTYDRPSAYENVYVRV